MASFFEKNKTGNMARANLVFFLSLKIWKKRPEKGVGVGGVVGTGVYK